MKGVILDLCGGTGSWAKPYKDAGYDVRTLTLPDNDVRKWREWEWLHALVEQKAIVGVLAAPPCTKFSKAAWQVKKADRDFKEGMECVRACLEIIWYIQENGAPLRFWALENPMGYLYNFLGKPAYYFQPWWFGETDGKRTKRTALWGYFNKPRRTVRVRDFPYISKERINKHWGGMSVEERAKTSEYFARAFYQVNQ